MTRDYEMAHKILEMALSDASMNYESTPDHHIARGIDSQGHEFFTLWGGTERKFILSDQHDDDDPGHPFWGWVWSSYTWEGEDDRSYSAWVVDYQDAAPANERERAYLAARAFIRSTQ